MLNDGPKRQGRFIKNNSRIISKVALSDFSFKEIGETTTIFHDNADRSIIHAKYHEQEEIDGHLKAPSKFNDEFIPKDQKRPVLQPRDFTKEWERDKKLRKARVARFSEDEDFEFELEEARAAEEAREAEESGQHGDGEPADESQPDTPETPVPTARPNQEPVAPPKLNKSEGLDYKAIDAMGKAINNLKQFPGHGDEEDALAEQAESVAKASRTAAKEPFIPVMANARFDADPEQAAAERYKQSVAEPQLSEEERAALMDEARAAGYQEGYQEGFKVGEEKGELLARNKAAAVFGKVSELIRELGGLKHEILNNVQENFYELAQAVAEALLKREFSINPETFTTVVRRAIDEAVEPGRFRVRVNPATYERVVPIADKVLAEALVKDSELDDGDFRVESDYSVVDVSVGKLIAELLEQADLQIFEEMGKSA